jgi:hypothetical protein
MEPVSLSKADRFFPLIANSPDDSGGSISLQNILDLKDSGMFDALRNLQRNIAYMRAQSQLFDDSLAEDPLLNTFFRFVDMLNEVINAKRVSDSGHFVTATRYDDSTVSIDAENFYLKPLKESLQHIQERYGRLEFNPGKSGEGFRGGVERVIAMTKWLLMKNHMIDYLMTFEVLPVQGSQDIMVKVPKWENSRAIPEAERRERLAEVEGFLIACCHPGRLGVFPAAKIQVNYGG